MTDPTSVIFDVGKVLHLWEPELLYARRIPDDAARSALLRDVLTTDWHFQHDAGRDPDRGAGQQQPGRQVPHPVAFPSIQ